MGPVPESKQSTIKSPRRDSNHAAETKHAVVSVRKILDNASRAERCPGGDVHGKDGRKRSGVVHASGSGQKTDVGANGGARVRNRPLSDVNPIVGSRRRESGQRGKRHPVSGGASPDPALHRSVVSKQLSYYFLVPILSNVVEASLLKLVKIGKISMGRVALHRTHSILETRYLSERINSAELAIYATDAHGSVNSARIQQAVLSRESQGADDARRDDFKQRKNGPVTDYYIILGGSQKYYVDYYRRNLSPAGIPDKLFTAPLAVYEGTNKAGGKLRIYCVKPSIPIPKVGKAKADVV